jgi:hypothetical protein
MGAYLLCCIASLRPVDLYLNNLQSQRVAASCNEVFAAAAAAAATHTLKAQLALL